MSSVYNREYGHIQDTYSDFSTARIACNNTDTDRDLIPKRASFVDSLGKIGTISRWVLETEQMPVVIIIGLVGFSLLGATVSRAVRVSQGAEANGSFTRLSFDDLVVVIAVGATAAVIVFLAAYGGLAVLGSNAGDPNPYVLFVTCLVAAVYSEDVWTWARSRGVASKHATSSDRSRRDEFRAGSRTTRRSSRPIAVSLPVSTGTHVLSRQSSMNWIGAIFRIPALRALPGGGLAFCRIPTILVTNGNHHPCVEAMSCPCVP